MYIIIIIIIIIRERVERWGFGGVRLRWGG